MDKRVLYVGGALAIALVASAAGYWGYTGTPWYSLGQIESAVEEGNRLRFQQYVDLDRFLPTAVDQFMNQSIMEQVSDEDATGFEALGSALGSALADRFKPALVQTLRSAILDGVQNGQIDQVFAQQDSTAEQPDDINLAEIGTSTGATPQTFAGIGEITKEADVALVELRFEQAHLDTTLALQLRMERADRRWRVVEVENLDSYLRTIEDLKAARLSALNAEQRAEVARHLRIGTAIRTAERFYSITTYEIDVPVTNMASEPLHLRFGWLKAAGVEGPGEILLSERDRLEPGDSTVLTATLINRGGSVAAAYRTGDLDDLEVEVSFVLGEKGAARYVGSYSSWEGYLAWLEDPGAFADRILAQRVRRGDTDVDDLLGRADAGPWLVSEDTNPLDDSPVVTLINTASEGRARFGDAPTLVLRCRENTTEAYINWSDYLGSDGPVVSYRIGDGKMQRQRWSLSTDSRATFYPGSHIGFIKELVGANRFVARVTPYGESPVTAVFELSGLPEHVQKLQRACHWN